MSFFSIPPLMGISQNPKRWKAALGGITLDTPGSNGDIASMQILGPVPETSNSVNKPVGVNLKAWQFKLNGDGVDRRNWTNELPLNGLVMVKRHGDKNVNPDPADCVMLGMPQWHAMMHAEALLDLDLDDESKMKATLDAIIEEWCIMGVNSATKPLNGKFESDSRMVAVFKKGIQQVDNYWGPEARGGKYSHFALKLCPVDVNTSYTTSIDGGQIITPGVMSKKGRILRYAPRFCALLSDNPLTPDVKQLMYDIMVENECIPQLAIPFKIGYCDWSRDNTHRAQPVDPTNRYYPGVNSFSQQTCGQIDILVDIMH